MFKEKKKNLDSRNPPHSIEQTAVIRRDHSPNNNPFHAIELSPTSMPTNEISIMKIFLGETNQKASKEFWQDKSTKQKGKKKTNKETPGAKSIQEGGKGTERQDQQLRG